MSTPFDYITDLSYDKKNIFKDDPLGFNAWMTNRAFSYFPDTVLHAAELNVRQNLTNDMLNIYYLAAVPKRKRFSKWYKPAKDEILDLVCQYYACGKREGRDYVNILSTEQIETIREKMNTGGMKNRR